jgi:hypothetical protein
MTKKPVLSLYLLLSYRAVSHWRGMIDLYGKMAVFSQTQYWCRNSRSGA